MAYPSESLKIKKMEMLRSTWKLKIKIEFFVIFLKIDLILNIPKIIPKIILLRFKTFHGSKNYLKNTVQKICLSNNKDVLTFQIRHRKIPCNRMEIIDNTPIIAVIIYSSSIVDNFCLKFNKTFTFSIWNYCFV